MRKTFLNHEKALLTVMLQCETPEVAIGRIRNANCLGAEAYGLQVESLREEYRNADTYKKIFNEMKGRPCYVTNYRKKGNESESDDGLAAGMLELARCGATLVDVMGDLFCRHPEELTEDPEAIIADIIKGVGDAKNYKIVTDRQKAIHYAMDIAEKDDIIVLAGKGHETYQIVGHTKLHMDEREIVAEYLQK